MIAREIEFPYVHDLGSLLSLLEETGEPVPEAIRTAVSLTTYATHHPLPQRRRTRRGARVSGSDNHRRGRGPVGGGEAVIPRECKRLAEVDFPIAEVSRHAVREKSIRHGHPSTAALVVGAASASLVSGRC